MASSIFGEARDSDVKFEMRRKSSFSKIIEKSLRRNLAFSHEQDTDLIRKRHEFMMKMSPQYIPASKEDIQMRIINHMEHTLGKVRFACNNEDCYRAVAYSIRDRLIEAMNDTSGHIHKENVKKCYYLSLEYLLGRAAQNALVNLDIESEYNEALLEMGYNLEELYEYEHDPALGNGGLGRLAACFLDSMATLDLPCFGYGIRYTYGIFEQKIIDGRQVEYPDYWLVVDNPWEICRHDVAYAVRFNGEVQIDVDPSTSKKKYRWQGGSIVQAVAYDNPIPGFDSYNCINLRLWKASPSKEFDFSSFNAGKYIESVSERQNAEAITAVLYPNDNNETGKILRLKQQYFFACATIQDILRRFKKWRNLDWRELPSKVAIQLNDTHPTIAIAEFMRIMIDVEDLPEEQAWDIAKQVFNYTNHTVLPEALEKWPQSIFENLLPRHLLIINDINFKFLTNLRSIWGDYSDKVSRMSIYEESYGKMIRMPNLAIIGSNKVNGVAQLHSQILKNDLFHDFVTYFERIGEPDKIINVTNGVTFRRWLHCCNPELSHLISEWIGSDYWLKDYHLLSKLSAHSNDEGLIRNWQMVKLKNKRKLVKLLSETCHCEGIEADNMLFDIQVKRIHEYKRPLLNLFYIIHRYLTIKKDLQNGQCDIQPRLCLIGGKAAPGYWMAKTIIKMTNNASSVINNDQEVAKYLKVVFMPNYNVSNAMTIIPAGDISHQISTAGTEASGTSCMKFVLNGCKLIGTLDGANVEISQECQNQCLFEFGLKVHEIENARNEARKGNYPIDPRLREVFDWIYHGNLAPNEPNAQCEFVDVINRHLNNGNGHNGDFYLVCADFADFCRIQKEIDISYKEYDTWTQQCIQATSRMGVFSSDRSIEEYAEKIWGITPCVRHLSDVTS